MDRTWVYKNLYKINPYPKLDSLIATKIEQGRKTSETLLNQEEKSSDLNLNSIEEYLEFLLEKQCRQKPVKEEAEKARDFLVQSMGKKSGRNFTQHLGSLRLSSQRTKNTFT